MKLKLNSISSDGDPDVKGNDRMKNNTTTNAINENVAMIHQYGRTTAVKIHPFLSGQKYLLAPARIMIAAFVLCVALGTTAVMACPDFFTSFVIGEDAPLFFF